MHFYAVFGCFLIEKSEYTGGKYIPKAFYKRKMFQVKCERSPLNSHVTTNYVSRFFNSGIFDSISDKNRTFIRPHNGIYGKSSKVILGVFIPKDSNQKMRQCDLDLILQKTRAIISSQEGESDDKSIDLDHSEILGVMQDIASQFSSIEEMKFCISISKDIRIQYPPKDNVVVIIQNFRDLLLMVLQDL